MVRNRQGQVLFSGASRASSCSSRPSFWPRIWLPRSWDNPGTLESSATVNALDDSLFNSASESPSFVI